MPTPFMHMALAERLIHDPEVPQNVRDLLGAEWGAFLLGSIAPDARVSSGVERSDTHFFEYAPVINPRPVSAMLTTYPKLRQDAVQNAAMKAFVAGYAAHLTMDEIWCTDLLFPTFINGKTWPSGKVQFLVLHLLLAYMDERDLQLLPPSHAEKISVVTPQQWLPFMSDEGLCLWRDTVASQLPPQGTSRTNEILGSRVSLTAAEMDAYIHDQAKMDELTWSNVPLERLVEVEQSMYLATREAVIAYLKG